MPLDEPLHVAHHLARQVVFGGEHQDPEVRIVQQQPGAEDADQRRLAGAAEDQKHKAVIALTPAPFQPFGDLEVQRWGRLALAAVPEPDELTETDRRNFGLNVAIGFLTRGPARAAHR